MNLFGRQFWSRFLTVSKPLFCSELRWKVLGLFGLLVALLLSVSGFNVINSFVSRDFMTAIADRRPGRFSTLALVYAGVFFISTVLAAFLRFTEERLRLLWRRWLTQHLTDRYLTGRAYQRIKARADIDNPDQRITEDVKSFTTETLALVLILLNSTISFCAFAGVLWSITPWLFLAAVGYAIFGSLLTALLGRRLIGLNIIQVKKEADLRYDLIRIRERAEQVALSSGEARANAHLRWRLGELVDTVKRIIGLNRNLAFFTEGFNYMAQLIPLLIVGPLFIRGDLEFGQVTQALMAFVLLLNASSLIVREFQRISTFAAVVTRLGSVWEAFETPVLAAPPVERFLAYRAGTSRPARRAKPLGPRTRQTT
jgi:vitamin B12/bleomycin/antimicrobial peptide transport system ATP-binding/permease protein